MNKIDVAFVVDAGQSPYLFTLVNSIRQNTNAHLCIHILTHLENVEYLETHFERIFPKLEVEIIAVSQLDRDEYCRRVEFVTEPHLQQGSVSMYKLLLAKYLSCDKCIYLDIDMVVQFDLAELFNQTLNEEYPFKAIHRPNYRQAVNVLMNIYQGTKDVDYMYLNAGMFLADLSYWRRHHLLELFVIILDFGRMMQISDFLDQAVLNVVFCKKCQPLDKKWNFLGLGWAKDLNENELEQAYILHYNGPTKPWDQNSLYKKYWQKYYIDPS